MPSFPRSVLPNGPVGQNGKLASGDELLEVPTTLLNNSVSNSVGDSDLNPHVFGPPGSRSIVRGMDPDPDSSLFS
jgi:hypothetical protein